MRIVPELAFINCCHLGRIEPGSTVKASALGDSEAAVRRQRRRGADQERRALCRGGRLGGGRQSGQAVRHALLCGAEGVAAAFAEAIGIAARGNPPDVILESNTWAAYQCYGDPDWRYRRNDDGSAGYAVDDPGFVSADDLTLQLETLTVQSRYGGDDRERTRTRLRHLEAVYGERWGRARAHRRRIRRCVRRSPRLRERHPLVLPGRRSGRWRRVAARKRATG